LSDRSQENRNDWAIPVIVSCLWVALGSAAIAWPGTESATYRTNQMRLNRMNPTQRQQVWQKYNDFLALPPGEREQVRRLNADLQNLATDKRERYRNMMDRYMKWKRTLPLYQQHMLEEAATKGSNELYAKFREVQTRKENEDRMRDYWFVPEATPAIRKAIPRILSRLPPEDIEELDLTPPLDRADKLIATAQRLGLEFPAPNGPGFQRQFLRGPLPPPDKEKFQEFLQTLPRERLEELGDLGVMKKARERRLFELYYREHPDEYRARMNMRPNQRGDR
jgi:hypothetical protein